MKKNGLLIAALLIVAIFWYVSSRSNIEDTTEQGQHLDPKNISYVIDSVQFPLTDGKFADEATSVALFEEPRYGDLDRDGDEDAAVLIVYNPGGSGTFFYVALALNQNNAYTSTNTMFIGDRIAPQTVEIKDGRAVYNYAERGFDEPMTAAPLFGKSLWVHLDPNTGEIGEWVKDFEGESR